MRSQCSTRRWSLFNKQHKLFSKSNPSVMAILYTDTSLIKLLIYLLLKYFLRIETGWYNEHEREIRTPICSHPTYPQNNHRHGSLNSEAGRNWCLWINLFLNFIIYTESDRNLFFFINLFNIIDFFFIRVWFDFQMNKNVSINVCSLTSVYYES